MLLLKATENLNDAWCPFLPTSLALRGCLSTASSRLHGIEGYLACTARQAFPCKVSFTRPRRSVVQMALHHRLALSIVSEQFQW